MLPSKGKNISSEIKKEKSYFFLSLRLVFSVSSVSWFSFEHIENSIKLYKINNGKLNNVIEKIPICNKDEIESKIRSLRV